MAGMEKTLIPNNITVSQQFVLMTRFRKAVLLAWTASEPKDPMDHSAMLEYIEQRFGVRCRVLENGLIVEPRVVDERKSLFLHFY